LRLRVDAEARSALHTAVTTDIIVRDLDATRDLAWASEVLDGTLAGRWQARRGELVDVLAVPGLVAERDGDRAGLLMYGLGARECEIEALVATTPAVGIGTALVEELRRRAERVPIRVVTTNDNVRAQRFYERLGFKVAEVRRGAVDEARRTLKPTIGLIGEGGIRISDEIELVLDTLR
jgi:GNAT superfamily N-acetyltransferase